MQGIVVGIGSIGSRRWLDQHVRNLYYRFTPSVGQGYAKELALTAVTMAQQHLASVPVIA